MSAKDIALSNEILRGVVGSTAYGTGLEGHEDRDEMGVFIEPALNVCGLSSIEHYIYRDKPDGVRSEPGDLDLTLYSLKKFCGLAAKGNPSVLVLLWLPNYLIMTDAGERLVCLRKAFISREAGCRFLGYLVSQKKALLGERSPKVSRLEIIKKYGYDTKFAMHALRLGLQGIEYLTEEIISVPIKEPHRSLLLAIRNGAIPLSDVLKLIEEAEGSLRQIIDRTVTVTDRAGIDRFLVDEHQLHWWRNKESGPAIQTETVPK